jgi:hypothetical protein
MIIRTGIKSSSNKGNKPLLLDEYPGAAAAYSMRKINSVYTGAAIRVRRSSDNTESDINFDTSGNLDENALLSFVGSTGINGLRYSNTFTNSYWFQNNVTISPNTADTSDPFGGNTASRITINTANTNSLYNYNSNQWTEVLNNTAYTFSFYVKRGSATELNYQISNFDGSASIIPITSYYSLTSNDWVRISVTFITPNNCNRIGVFPLTNSSSTGTFYLYGAQLNIGTAALNYEGTTNLSNFGLGYVRTWYDQSGNGRNCNSATTNQQPIIVKNGLIGKQNGKPSIEFDGWNDGFDFNWGINIRCTSVAVAKVNDNSASKVLVSMGTDRYPILTGSDERYYGLLQSYTNVAVSETNTNFVSIVSQQFTGGNTFISINGNVFNGTNTVDSTSTPATCRIGGFSGTTFPWFGFASEIILYPSDQSVNRVNIEFNINSYYKIHEPLLDTYFGAAAAYSLRKLRAAYTGAAIQVRRSNDNALQDIGFTAAGDLDESVLLAFVGSNSGFVVKWYDQSGNARDAVQATTANQPRIVNAGVVEKVDGKPYCFFNGTSHRLINASSPVTSAFTAISVARKTNANTIGHVISLANSVNNVPFIQLNRYGSSGKWEFILRQDSSSSSDIISASANSYLNNTKYLLFNTSSGTAFNSHANSNNVLSVSYSVGAITLNTIAIGALGRGSPSEFFGGDISEAILYPSDQSTNRTAIETNINSYYNIY